MVFILSLMNYHPPVWSNTRDIVSLTLTLGWKNKKQPSGPIELDLKAGNLVFLSSIFDQVFSMKLNLISSSEIQIPMIVDGLKTQEVLNDPKAQKLMK